jgi:hypothetical protein
MAKSVACGCAPARSGSGNGRRGTVAGVSEHARGPGAGAGAAAVPVPLPPLARRAQVNDARPAHAHAIEPPVVSCMRGGAARWRARNRVTAPVRRRRRRPGLARGEWHGSHATAAGSLWSAHRAGPLVHGTGGDARARKNASARYRCFSLTVSESGVHCGHRVAHIFLLLD